MEDRPEKENERCDSDGEIKDKKCPRFSTADMTISIVGNSVIIDRVNNGKSCNK